MQPYEFMKRLQKVPARLRPLEKVRGVRKDRLQEFLLHMMDDDPRKYTDQEVIETGQRSSMNSSEIQKMLDAFSKLTGRRGAMELASARVAIRYLDKVACACGDELQAGREHGERGKGYGETGPDVRGPGKWKPEAKPKCFYETGDEKDRCYATQNGGPGGQTKPGPSTEKGKWTDYEKQRWAREAAGKPKSIEDLPSKEKSVAEKMKAKGYTHIVQVTANGKDFGEPLYFKSADQVGPFLRTFPDSAKAKTAWSLTL